jgi:hypothetical protein
MSENENFLTDDDHEFRLHALDLIAKADAMYRELYGYFKAKSDEKYQAEFGHDGPALAGFPIHSPEGVFPASSAGTSTSKRMRVTVSVPSVAFRRRRLPMPDNPNQPKGSGLAKDCWYW